MCALLAALSEPRPGAAAEVLDSYLLPGIDIRNVEMDEGRWCRYLVIDEAEGVADSSTVYVAMLGLETIAGEESFWLELESAPVGAAAGDRDATRVLVSSCIRDLARGDSLYRYVRRMYIRRGTNPAEPADPRDLQRLTLARPTSDQDWTVTPDDTLETPGGSFVCERREFAVEESRRVEAGRVTILQRRSDRFTIWSSDEVPLFGLARCVIERTRESKTVPRVSGIPEAGPRASRVTTLLLEYGSGARALIPLDHDYEPRLGTTTESRAPLGDKK